MFLNVLSKPKIIRPFEIAVASAKSTEDIPSVVMKESICILTIKKALSAPIKAPSTTVMIHADKILIPPLISSQETVIELREMTAPIDKSKTPAAKGAISPSATMIRTAS